MTFSDRYHCCSTVLKYLSIIRFQDILANYTNDDAKLNVNVKQSEDDNFIIIFKLRIFKKTMKLKFAMFSSLQGYQY